MTPPMTPTQRDTYLHPWRRSARALRRAPWLVAAMLIACALIPLANTVAPAPSTIDFPHLRPIDARTRGLCLATGFAGLLVGWIAGMLSVSDRAHGLPLAMPPSFHGFSSLPGHRAMVAALLAAVATGWGLLAAGLDTSLAIRVALVNAIAAATVALLLPVLLRSPLAACFALPVLAALSTASLFSITGSPFAFVAALLPPFWVGHTLTADQFGINAKMAGTVGICLGLLPLAAAVGLNVMARDAERGPQLNPQHSP